ncbi:transcriptional regulator [Sphaerisporangium melleum]|uniref:Transcriptional regulator n=2 Tax=Sphaerisporangium melleum TaxID=321316 RepID=A0A917R4Q5_9ACTN|nr:helix-turn-helix transcriptional regulator [Sphaerisporangium melleum]GGK87800.1 transcriptional regulator [Sphaerisporangium melleum]GII72445.1 transcriptional regulator [Sphaerisporangium melleum]
MDVTDQQRRALASFLRSRRERLSPKKAGIQQTYGRRRTCGLRREELASLAGVSVTWYTWLEQARRIRVSRQVLSSLGRALQLDDLETAHLFRLAGESPPSAGHPCSKEDIHVQYLTFLDALDPLPAVICNHRFDVLAWNHGFSVLFPHFEQLPIEERNTLLMTFEERTRTMYSDWDQHAMQTVALFRAQNAENLVQPEYVDLITGLEARSPEFRDLWRRMDLETGGPALRTLDHPSLGRLHIGYVKLALINTDATLIVHQPVLNPHLLAQLRELVEERRGAQRQGRPPWLTAVPEPRGFAG